MPETGRGLGGVPAEKLAGRSTAVASAQQNRDGHAAALPNPGQEPSPQRCSNQRINDRPMISPIPAFQSQDGRSANRCSQVGS